MDPIGADQRILQGVAGTLQVTLLDYTGAAADASGALTVKVTRADGTTLVAAGTATVHGTTGVYTGALTPAQTATLDLLTATWTDAGDGSVTVTTHEIVGGFYFSIADARASDTSLTNATKYPDALILTTRQEVEEECEKICDVAFTSRYRRIALDGDGTNQLILPDNQIRTIRSIRVYSDLATATYTAFTSTQLANVFIDPDNRIERTDYAWFDEGRGNIVIEYEHGYNRPAADLKRASLIRLRSRLNAALTGIPDRATSFTSAEGGTYRLARTSAYKTGIDEVDGTYERYSLRSSADGEMVPASRRMDFDSQFGSLFHGGKR